MGSLAHLQLLQEQAMSPLFEPGYSQQLPQATCPQCSCSEDTGPQLLCMEVYVFVFCIFVSAVTCGLVVSSRDILQELNKIFKLRRAASVHKPRRLSHEYDSGKALSESKPERMLAKTAEAIDRAVAPPSEDLDEAMVPARYVRAFCGKEHHASERWKATLAWRKENGIDAILGEPQPHFHDIRRYFPSYMSGRSRAGHIVVYEKLGGVDMMTLSKLGVTVPMLLRHWIFVSEYMYRVLQPTDAAQQVTVEDMRGVQLQSLAGKIQHYVQGAAQLARLYYVERCHKTFVVNAPSWFGFAFRIVSPFLSARTRQKIRILGKDLSPLHDEIDPAYLPVEYGGANSVPVDDSVEERHLRHLVDTINAKAAQISDSRNSNRVKRRSNTRSPPHVERRGSVRAKSPDRLIRSAPTTPAMNGSKHHSRAKVVGSWRKDAGEAVDGGAAAGRAERQGKGSRGDSSSSNKPTVLVPSEARILSPATSSSGTRPTRASTFESPKIPHATSTYQRRATWGGPASDRRGSSDDLGWAAAAVAKVPIAAASAPLDNDSALRDSRHSHRGGPGGGGLAHGAGAVFEGNEGVSSMSSSAGHGRGGEMRPSTCVARTRPPKADRASLESMRRGPGVGGHGRSGESPGRGTSACLGVHGRVFDRRDEGVTAAGKAEEDVDGDADMMMMEAKLRQVTRDLGVVSDYDYEHELEPRVLASPGGSGAPSGAQQKVAASDCRLLEHAVGSGGAVEGDSGGFDD